MKRRGSRMKRKGRTRVMGGGRVRRGRRRRRNIEEEAKKKIYCGTTIKKW